MEESISFASQAGLIARHRIMNYESISLGNQQRIAKSQNIRSSSRKLSSARCQMFFVVTKLFRFYSGENCYWIPHL